MNPMDLQSVYRHKVVQLCEHLHAARAVERRFRRAVRVGNGPVMKEMAIISARLLFVLNHDVAELEQLNKRIHSSLQAMS